MFEQCFLVGGSGCLGSRFQWPRAVGYSVLGGFEPEMPLYGCRTILGTKMKGTIY